MSRNWLYIIPALGFALIVAFAVYPHFPKMTRRLLRLWELLVIRYVLVTGRGRRSREWKRYRRSEGSRKAWVTRKANMAYAAYCAEHSESSAEKFDHEGDAL